MSLHTLFTRDAWRSLRRRPLSAVLSLLSAAIGVAAAGVALSIVRTTLVRPLPYPHSEGIVEVNRTSKAIGSRPFTYRFFYTIRDRVPGLETVGALNTADMTLQLQPGGTNPARVTALASSASLLEILDVHPLVGRRFDASEEERSAGAAVALVSEELWRDRFVGDPGVVGKTVWLNDRAFQIIGVVPAKLRVPPLPFAPGVWIPLGADPMLDQLTRMFPEQWDQSVYLKLWGRLAPETSRRQAEAALRSVSASVLAEQEPGNQAGPLQLVSVEGEVKDRYRGQMYVLIAAAVLALFIACANSYGLAVTRALPRQTEVAIRRALGERPAHATVRIVLDGALLAAGGAALGLAFTPLLLRALEAHVPLGMLPFQSTDVSPSVLVLVAALPVATLIAALLPAAVRLAGSPLYGAGASAPRASTGQAGARYRNIVVVLQSACAVASLATLLSLFRAYHDVATLSLGFDADSVLVAELTLPENGESRERWRTAALTLERDLASRSRVVDAAVSVALPTQRTMRPSFRVSGRASTDGSMVAEYRPVSARYFAALRIPIVRGRAFETSDADPVCVVSQSLARSTFASGDAVGQQVQPMGASPCRIIGVAGDVASADLRAAPVPTIYVPFSQMPIEAIQSWLSVIARVRSSPTGGAFRADEALFRQVVLDAARTLPVRVSPLRGITDNLTAVDRFHATLMSAVAVVALTLLGAGVYGVASTYVASRRRELATRAALGASTARLVSSVVLEGLRLGSIGVILGWVLAVVALSAVRRQMPYVPGMTALAVAGVSAAIGLLLGVFSYLPSRAIARINPASVLREG